MARFTKNFKIVVNSISKDRIEDFLGKQGVLAPFEKIAITNGKNSKVWKICKSNKYWILKKYYQCDFDVRDRLGTEFDFLELLKNIGIKSVPNAVGMDRKYSLALYSFLPGERPSVIFSNHIKQAAEFIGEINKPYAFLSKSNVRTASDSCFCLLDHFALVDDRVNLLINVKPRSKLEDEVSLFIRKQLQPYWSQLKKCLLSKFDLLQLKEKILYNERIISPSDFGFHNTIEYKSKLYFVDFEYAGWDDPAKLICDFICQPEVQITEAQGHEFLNNIEVFLPKSIEIKSRVDYLLPIHRIKWCFILLNEFKVENRKRRLHAGIEYSEMLEKQFTKVVKYYESHIL